MKKSFVTEITHLIIQLQKKPTTKFIGNYTGTSPKDITGGPNCYSLITYIFYEFLFRYRLSTGESWKLPLRWERDLSLLSPSVHTLKNWDFEIKFSMFDFSFECGQRRFNNPLGPQVSEILVTVWMPTENTCGSICSVRVSMYERA